MRFLHTADWQIGKPFQSIQNVSKRESLRKQRVDTLRALSSIVKSENIEFVIVCGDLFDSSTPDKPTVSNLCSAVGELIVPVYAIPGNHDHGGPGCIWQQDFFLREQQQLAPNLQLLLNAEPVITENAVFFPCPLTRRHISSDPTTWLQSPPADLPNDRPWIALAHGSTQGFSSSGDEEISSSTNQIDLSKLPDNTYDYIALGDWHGLKQIQSNAWYSGTPEQDRFARGESNEPGHVLVIDIPGRGQTVQVNPIKTSTIGWHAMPEFSLTSDADLDSLEAKLEPILGNRTQSDLLKLSLSGTLSLSGYSRLLLWIEQLEARLIRLRLEQDIQIEPSPEEIESLTLRQDPLIATVASELKEQTQSSDPEIAAIATDALRELYLQLQSHVS